AGGISEALVATAAGIAVAIEAVVLFNLFTSAISSSLTAMRLAADEVLELLLHRGPMAEDPAPAEDAAAART
ncbi:MAG: MotA/TolQ/ExbB proton channel family protein, partial [Deltaproteobacteria bacterium]|nr:MotA/TolQ/ExbB proton channel family protein [Deltaproteobacteria bacterium]